MRSQTAIVVLVVLAVVIVLLPLLGMIGMMGMGLCCAGMMSGTPVDGTPGMGGLALLWVLLAAGVIIAQLVVVVRGIART